MERCGIGSNGRVLALICMGGCRFGWEGVDSALYEKADSIFVASLLGRGARHVRRARVLCGGGLVFGVGYIVE